MLSAATSMVAPDVENESRDAERDASARMRALFVLATLGVGGSETKTVRIVNALAARGMPAGVAYLNPPEDLRPALDPAAPVWRLDRRGKLSLNAVKSLRALIREHKPDVVFAVNLYAALYVAMASVGLRDRPRTVGMINTSEFTSDRAWRATFYRPVIGRLDRTVYGSESQRLHWLSLLKYPSERSMVLYNGVDARHFAPDSLDALRDAERRRLGLPAEAFVVGTVGRFAPEKNQRVLIDAIAALRDRGLDARLLLVGDGRIRAALESRAAELGVRDRVIFAGKSRDVRPALSAMDAFVLPSTHVETFSNAALEAMAMSRAVILSNIGGAAEMVRNGVDGFTLEREELATELAPLLARLQASDDLRRRLGESARARVLNKFSLDNMVQGYATIIHDMQRAPDRRA